VEPLRLDDVGREALSYWWSSGPDDALVALVDEVLDDIALRRVFDRHHCERDLSGQWLVRPVGGLLLVVDLWLADEPGAFRVAYIGPDIREGDDEPADS